MELKGKQLSLGAKILASVVVVGAFVVKAFWAPDLDIDAAIKAAGFVVVVFSPVDVSLWIENVFGRRPRGDV